MGLFQSGPRKSVLNVHDSGVSVAVVLVTLLKMGRYYNTTMRHYWDMVVK